MRWFIHIIPWIIGDLDLAGMNKNKEGKSYLYPYSFILSICYMHICFRMPYRQTDEIIQAIEKSLSNPPCHEHTSKRINKLNIENSSSNNKKERDSASRNQAKDIPLSLPITTR